MVQASRQIGLSSVFGLFAFISLAVTQSGCSSLMGRSKGPLDNVDMRGLKAAGYSVGASGVNKPLLTDNGEPCVILEINDGKKHYEKLPLQPGQSLFVGDVVRDAQLFKKIGRMKATVLRPNGVNRPPVRLDVDFDDAGKNVMEGQNYSLRAGDHVIIRRDESTFVGEMMKSMSLGK
jgi:hypothetical protein